MRYDHIYDQGRCAGTTFKFQSTMTRFRRAIPRILLDFSSEGVESSAYLANVYRLLSKPTPLNIKGSNTSSTTGRVLRVLHRLILSDIFLSSSRTRSPPKW